MNGVHDAAVSQFAAAADRTVTDEACEKQEKGDEIEGWYLVQFFFRFEVINFPNALAGQGHLAR